MISLLRGLAASSFVESSRCGTPKLRPLHAMKLVSLSRQGLGLVMEPSQIVCVGKTWLGNCARLYAR